jgi:tetraacyldisaccharide-1-P 4'-kinase
VRAVYTFADHHDYKFEEVESLCAPGTELLVTAKDAVKLRELGVACNSLEVELEIIEGVEVLRALIEAKARGGQDG